MRKSERDRQRDAELKEMKFFWELYQMSNCLTDPQEMKEASIALAAEMQRRYKALIEDSLPGTFKSKA